MVIYKCLCNYESTDRDRMMKKHLDRKIKCLSNLELDLDKLIISPRKSEKRENLKHLTEEEKYKRYLQQKIRIQTRFNKLGSMNIHYFAKQIFYGIKRNTKFRNIKRDKLKKDLHEITLTYPDVLKMLIETNGLYIVNDTIYGTIKFPIVMTNGYHNSASFDRIDDNLGYNIDNIEIRPHFFKYTSQINNRRYKICFKI